MKIDGRCHCGFIEYEAEIDPAAVYVCHCTDCQSISGSPYRWAVPVLAEKFKLITGESKVYAKISASGATSHQHFCPQCASPLYSTAVGREPKSYNLRLGTARQRAMLPPRRELWCDSAQEWANIDSSTEKLRAQ